MDSSREALLVETKRLLAALNDENRTLKADNTRLLSQSHSADDALSRLRTERDALERDLKQINFNLMQQLRGRVSALKAAEHRITTLQHDLHTVSKELQTQRAQSATMRSQVESHAAAEWSARLQHTHDALQTAQTALSTEQHEHAEAMRQCREKALASARVTEELQLALHRTRDALRHAEGGGNARQTALEAMRAEVHAAHTELHRLGESAHTQLTQWQRLLQDATNETGEMREAWKRVKEKLETHVWPAMEQFGASQEAVVAYLCALVMRRERELTAALAEKETWQQAAKEAKVELERWRSVCDKTRRSQEVESHTREEEVREFAAVVGRALRRLSASVTRDGTPDWESHATTP